MYRVLSPNGGLVNVVKMVKDNPDGDIYEVLDNSGRTIVIDNLPRLLKETRESQEVWRKAGMTLR
jgi:hypothetical protein